MKTLYEWTLYGIQLEQLETKSAQAEVLLKSVKTLCHCKFSHLKSIVH